jgi:hypothetical protein
MIQLFPAAMLLVMLSPQNQELPAEFYRIPEGVRDTATVVLSGTFGQGRTPCIMRPDGTRVWGVDSWFDVKVVYRGKVGNRQIRIRTAMLPKARYVSTSLKHGARYLVLLQPSKESMEKIKTRDGLGFWDALRNEEIVAVVESR